MQTDLLNSLLRFGDAIDGLLAVSTVTKARKVSDGLDDGIRTKMAINVAIEIVVGFTPVLGDLIDSLFKVNTRNATLLEEMLIDRVTKAKEKAEAEMMKAEKTGRASSRSRAHTDRYLDPEAASRTLQHAQTGSYYDSEPTPQRRDRAQVNGYHEPEPAPALPARGIDERHGGVHERLGRKADSPARAPKPSRSGGSWFNGRKNRKGDAVAQGTNRTRGREMPQVEDLGPARLPRPDTTRQQNVVHF